MSIVLWDKDVYVECPYCKKIMRLNEQESEAYGVGVYADVQDDVPTKAEILKHNKKVDKEGGVKIELVEFGDE